MNCPHCGKPIENVIEYDPSKVKDGMPPMILYPDPRYSRSTNISHGAAQTVFFDDVGPFTADIDRPRSNKELVDGLNKHTRLIDRKDDPLPFDPDDYPLK